MSDPRRLADVSAAGFWADAVALGLVIGATLWVYAPAGSLGFVSYDDPTYVVDNVRVWGGLSFENLKWAFTTTHFSNWHPLTWLSYMLDVSLFGLDPGALHRTNLLLHLVNVGFVYVVIRQLGGNAQAAGFVAGLFALHPLHVESVAWISERKGLLSTCFGLASLLAYVRWTRTLRRTTYGVCALLLALGLAAKPMLVSWPVLFLLLDWALLDRMTGNRWDDVRRLILEKLPLFALVIASCVITVIAQRSGHSLIPLEALEFGPRVANALTAYAGYLRLALWPTGLAPIHPHPAAGWAVSSVVLSGLCGFALCAVVVMKSRGREALAAGWLWYLISLVPVIGIVQVGSQALADRYTYVPLLGIYSAVVWGVARMTPRPAARRAAIAIGVIVVAVLGLVTQSQLEHWRSSRALFAHTVAVTGPNFVAQLHLGSALLQEGAAQEALGHYRAADAIVPAHPLAALGVASALARLGQFDAARFEIESMLEVAPNWVEGLVTLGTLNLMQKRFDSAREFFRRALSISGDRVDAHNGLGVAIANAGDPEAAIPHFQQALRLDPGHRDAARNLSLAQRAIRAEAR